MTEATFRTRARAAAAALATLLLVLAACTTAAPTTSVPTEASAPSASGSTAAPGTPANSPDSEGPFANGTLGVLVNFPAGGGCDTGARLLVKHLGANIAGNPQLFVQNIPGAGGLVGLNTLYATSSDDGMTAGWVCGMLAPLALGTDTVQFDATKFRWLGAAYESQVMYVRSELGIDSLAALAEADGIISGGFAPDSTKDLGIQTVLNLLGTDYRHVSGYPGNNDVRIALERGEINLHEETVTGHLTAMQQFLDAGTVVAIGQRGIPNAEGEMVRDPRIPDIPTYLEAIREIKGAAVVDSVEYNALDGLVKVDALIRAFVYPPTAPDEFVDEMRAAVSATIESDAFLDDAAIALGASPIFVPGAEAQSAVEQIVAQLTDNPEATEYLRALATPE